MFFYIPNRSILGGSYRGADSLGERFVFETRMNLQKWIFIIILVMSMLLFRFKRACLITNECRANKVY